MTDLYPEIEPHDPVMLEVGDAYGNLTASGGPANSTLRFAGQYQDPESCLMYYAGSLLRSNYRAVLKA